jgi:hypothetical protein
VPTHRELWTGRGFKSLGGTPLPALFLIFAFFLLVQSLKLDLRAQYALFLICAVVTSMLLSISQAETFPQFKDLVIPKGYTADKAYIPAVTWGIIVGSIMLVLVGVTNQWGAASSKSYYDNFQLMVTEVLIVASTEAYYFRYVLMRSRMGGFLPQILFAVSHPIIRNTFLVNPLATIPYFVYFVVFGLLFQEMVILGQASDVNPKVARFFGLAAELGAHGMFNFMVILFPNLIIMGVAPMCFEILGPTFCTG